MLNQLLGAVREGEGRALVVRGEAGVGKTALLDYLAEQASGCQVVRAAGVQSEMELAFAGLHQLCAPLLERTDRLPVPQRDALRIAFGLSSGLAPERFLVGLAVLGLVSDVAGERPLLCVVDDVQWLDRTSSQVLGFVARRLGADPVGLVFAARVPGDDVAGLPELAVEGLGPSDARALLDSVLTGPLDARVRDQIVAEMRGNPLALLELPRGLSPTELAGGFGLPGVVPLSGRIEQSFRGQIDLLPASARRLLVLAAADPSGDPLLVRRAAERLGLPADAGGPAADAGLVEFSPRVRFRHPLTRSAAYRSATTQERGQAHAALAEATDQALDPDRRAWHRAAAALVPDEDVAAELERCADRAQARGGLAAAAAFLERAMTLTPEPAGRAGRALAAAQANLRAGAFDKARDLLATAEAGPLDDFYDAQAGLLRGQLAFASGPGSDAPPLLLKAAKRLEPFDRDLARETYIDAWEASVFAGHLAGAGDLLEVSRAARTLSPPASSPRPADLLLDGFALLVTEGPAVAAPVLRQATKAFAAADIPIEESLRWGWLSRVADKTLWDDQGRRITARQVQLARDVGALDQLPIILNMMAMDAVWSGDLTIAAELTAEAGTVCEATGTRLAPYPGMMLASFRGRETEAAPLIQAAIDQATVGGEGAAVTNAEWAAAILFNGLRRYADALAAALRASEHKHIYASSWAWPELIEAAVRTGDMGLAGETLDRLTETTKAGGTDLGLGIDARSRALLSEAEAAEDLYHEAISRLGRTRRRPDLARAHLLFGEWLRRERRRGEARGQLRTACHMLEAMGMEAFAERARRELAAAGEPMANRIAEAGRTSSGRASQQLTAQEAQVAQLARDGLSNPDIAARLFISTRTVQYHLGKVFAKLGIDSRGQLYRVLPGGPRQ